MIFLHLRHLSMGLHHQLKPTFKHVTFYALKHIWGRAAYEYGLPLALIININLRMVIFLHSNISEWVDIKHSGVWSPLPPSTHIQAWWPFCTKTFIFFVQQTYSQHSGVITFLHLRLDAPHYPQTMLLIVHSNLSELIIPPSWPIANIPLPTKTCQAKSTLFCAIKALR